jgi:hypothetical protein
MTPLDKTLKRAIKIKGEEFVITLTATALKVTRKGHRHGIELLWDSLVSGERALAIALQASVGQVETPLSAPRSKQPARKLKRRR